VRALGFPAITVVTTTSQEATNSGDDEGANAQTTSADVKPDVDASVVPTRRATRPSPFGANGFPSCPSEIPLEAESGQQLH